MKKLLSFKTEKCIDKYKKNTKERNLMKGFVESHLQRKSPLTDSSFRDLEHTFFIIGITIFSILSVITIKNYAFDKEMALVIALYLIISFMPSIIFLRMQCKYILNEFRKIDEEDRNKNDNLKKSIAACNLYLK